MTPQDTMRLALEALESLQRYDGTLTGAQVATAIESLRGALVQQGEAVCVVDRRIPGDVRWKEWCRNLPDGTPLYAGAAPTAQSDDKDLLTIAAMDAYQMGKRDALAQQEGQDRATRIGAYILETAKSLGWKDDGEGAYEYIQRLSYAQGMEDALSQQMEQRPSTIKAGEIAIGVLCDRKGFDEWWDGIGEDMQQEIIAELEDAIAGAPSTPQPSPRKVIEQMVKALEIAERHLAYAEITETREAGQQWLKVTNGQDS